jgi:hypothetical protein
MLSDNPFKGRRVDPVGEQLARQLVVVSGALSDSPFVKISPLDSLRVCGTLSETLCEATCNPNAAPLPVMLG